MNNLLAADAATIVQLGNQVLHQGAVEVQNITSSRTQHLINVLTTAVDIAGGVGIAAPQIAENQRLFIISSKPNKRYPNAPLMKPTVMINPKLHSHNNKQKKDWEGCLSVPKLRGFVPRYTEISVSYFDESGNEQQRIFTDFIARVFQHELDHLNGLTFIDRVESVKDLISEQEWYLQYQK